MNTHSLSHVGPVNLPLDWDAGQVKSCRLDLYERDGHRYLLAAIGVLSASERVLVRVQSACALADFFGSRWCDCAWQFKEAKRRIFQADAGLLVFCYDQHGKGIGLRDHYRVYAEGQRLKQELLTETFEFLNLPYDNRSYDSVVEILRHLGISSIRLMTNDPARLEVFEEHGIDVEREALVPPFDPFNETELRIKRTKFGHLIPLPEETATP